MAPLKQDREVICLTLFTIVQSFSGIRSVSWTLVGFGSSSILNPETVWWPSGNKQCHITSKTARYNMFLKTFQARFKCVVTESAPLSDI